MAGERNQMMRSSPKAELLKKYVTLGPDNTAMVQSQSNDTIYHINGDDCECPDNQHRGNYCKHLQARDLKQQEEFKKIQPQAEKILEKMGVI